MKRIALTMALIAGSVVTAQAAQTDAPAGGNNQLIVCAPEWSKPADGHPPTLLCLLFNGGPTPTAAEKQSIQSGLTAVQALIAQHGVDHVAATLTAHSAP